MELIIPILFLFQEHQWEHLHLKIFGLDGNGSTPAVSGYRYLRLNMTAAPNGYPVIADLYWTVGTTDYPTVDMTSNNAPSPLVASASSEYATGLNYTWRAFYRNGGFDYWNPDQAGQPWWLQIDLGAGNSITPTAVGIAPHFTYWPSSFTCLGSATGAFAGEETLLLTVAGATTGWTSYTRRDFTF